MKKRNSNKEAINFYKKALVYRGDDCLLWPFGNDGRGYGLISISWNRKTRLIHRLICEDFNGLPPTPKYQAAHKCGNRSCINPRHLRWATCTENVQDMWLHGTMLYGEKNSQAKLTKKAVLKIRALRGKLSQEKIAFRFNIDRSLVSLIHNRKAWAWL